MVRDDFQLLCDAHTRARLLEPSGTSPVELRGRCLWMIRDGWAHRECARGPWGREKRGM